jgi:hypothetical protein
MNKQQFDAEFSALSDKLSSVLAGYPIALDAMNKADKGEQLLDAIKNYENLIDDEMRIRQQIGVLHAKYINYLDDIIDGANRRAVNNTVYKQATRRACA